MVLLQVIQCVWRIVADEREFPWLEESDSELWCWCVEKFAAIKSELRSTLSVSTK